MTLKAVVDTDPGVDDFAALLMAFRSPELEVNALTTVGGNAALRMTTRNALGLLNAAGRSVPVFRGRSRPLRGAFGYAYHFHGSNGIGVRLPAPAGKARPGGVPYLAAVLDGRRKADVLVALGPLTNVALALRLATRAPAVPLLVMGGAVDRPGNITQHAEFNFWGDPLAAREVLRSSAEITLVPLDVCNAVAFEASDFDASDPTLRAIVRAWFERHPGRKLGLADAVAVATLTLPSAFSFEKTGIDVITEGEQAGKSVRSKGPPLKVATSVDPAAVRKHVLGRLT